MKEDYLSYIKMCTFNNKIHFKLSDIKNYLIDDIDVILVKLNYFGIEDKMFSGEYIDAYSLILLIAFSNDFRTYKYKFYLCSSAVEKLSEIMNPELCIDRSKALQYKKGYDDSYKYIGKRKSSGKNNMAFNEIVKEEINNSLNIDAFRQII